MKKEIYGILFDYGYEWSECAEKDCTREKETETPGLHDYALRENLYKEGAMNCSDFKFKEIDENLVLFKCLNESEKLTHDEIYAAIYDGYATKEAEYNRK